MPPVHGRQQPSAPADYGPTSVLPLTAARNSFPTVGRMSKIPGKGTLQS